MKIERKISGFFFSQEFTDSVTNTPVIPFQRTAIKKAPRSFASGDDALCRSMGPDNAMEAAGGIPGSPAMLLELERFDFAPLNRTLTPTSRKISPPSPMNI